MGAEVSALRTLVRKTESDEASQSCAGQSKPSYKDELKRDYSRFQLKVGPKPDCYILCRQSCCDEVVNHLS